MVTIVCTRWLDAFPASYVTVLRNAVAANLRREHRFVCVTDNPGDLCESVEGILMPELGIPTKYQREGCWPKLSILQPGLLPPSQPTLYLDLDVVIRDSLDPFFDQLESSRGFHALREWNPALWNLLPLSLRPHRGVQGSILGFYPEEQHGLYTRFVDHLQDNCRRYDSDQDFLSHHATAVQDWPVDWTASFKRRCVRYFPFNQILPAVDEPVDARVVVFHGSPRPIEVVPQGHYRWGTKRKFGHGPVDWVRAYWLRHDSTWNEQISMTKRAA